MIGSKYYNASYLSGGYYYDAKNKQLKLWPKIEINYICSSSSSSQDIIIWPTIYKDQNYTTSNKSLNEDNFSVVCSVALNEDSGNIYLKGTVLRIPANKISVSSLSVICKIAVIDRVSSEIACGEKDYAYNIPIIM